MQKPKDYFIKDFEGKLKLIPVSPQFIENWSKDLKPKIKKEGLEKKKK